MKIAMIYVKIEFCVHLKYFSELMERKTMWLLTRNVVCYIKLFLIEEIDNWQGLTMSIKLYLPIGTITLYINSTFKCVLTHFLTLSKALNKSHESISDGHSSPR